MWKLLQNALSIEPDPTLLIDSVYGIDFKPNPSLLKKRANKLEALKREMGDKYLLHTHMERKNG